VQSEDSLCADSSSSRARISARSSLPRQRRTRPSQFSSSAISVCFASLSSWLAWPMLRVPYGEGFKPESLGEWPSRHGELCSAQPNVSVA
jgi:hypothetical protein